MPTCRAGHPWTQKSRKPDSDLRLLLDLNLVPKAGLEPARISPHAPQTCASTNSATWAGCKGTDPSLTLGMTRLRASLLNWSDRGCRSCFRAAHHRTAGTGLEDRQREGGDDEQREERDRELVQERRRAARAERCLRSAATECTCEVGSFALLDEDDQDQEDADDDVDDDEQYGHGFSEPASQRGRGVNSSRN